MGMAPPLARPEEQIPSMTADRCWLGWGPGFPLGFGWHYSGSIILPQITGLAIETPDSQAILQNPAQVNRVCPSTAGKCI